MSKRLNEFCTSSNRGTYVLHLYAWATYKRGEWPDAGEFDYINKRVTNKFPTAEFVKMERSFVPNINGGPPTEVRWEFKWTVYDYDLPKEVRDAD